MSFLKKLDHNLWTALIVTLVAILGFLSSCFLISSNYQDIPFGFLLSGGIIALIYVGCYFFNLIDKRKGTTIFTIISMSFRLVVLLVSLILIFFMYYRWNIKLFNVFVFIGVYSLSIILLCISFVFRKIGKE